MSIAGLIASLLLTLFVLFWVGVPFIGQQNQSINLNTSRLRQEERMHLYYERVLLNINDLDEDRATGKLNEDDYNADRSIWVRRGVEILKRIDKLSDDQLIAPLDADDAVIDTAIDQSIETAVHAYQDQAEST